MSKMKNESRFADIKPFEKKVWLSSPTMHGDEMKYIQQAYETNWMSTVGENINEVERIAAGDLSNEVQQIKKFKIPKVLR